MRRRGRSDTGKRANRVQRPAVSQGGASSKRQPLLRAHARRPAPILDPENEGRPPMTFHRAGSPEHGSPKPGSPQPVGSPLPGSPTRRPCPTVRRRSEPATRANRADCHPSGRNFLPPCSRFQHIGRWVLVVPGPPTGALPTPPGGMGGWKELRWKALEIRWNILNPLRHKAFSAVAFQRLPTPRFAVGNPLELPSTPCGTRILARRLFPTEMALEGVGMSSITIGNISLARYAASANGPVAGSDRAICSRRFEGGPSSITRMTPVLKSRFMASASDLLSNMPERSSLAKTLGA